MSDFLIFDFKRRYKKEWYSLRLPGWQALKERNIIVRGNAVGKQRNTKQPPLRGGAKKIQNILYNTIKDPHRYDVQVSDPPRRTGYNDDHHSCFFAGTKKNY